AASPTGFCAILAAANSAIRRIRWCGSVVRPTRVSCTHWASKLRCRQRIVGLGYLSARPFSDHHEWSPGGGMRVAATCCDQRQHGAAQRLCAADSIVVLDLLERLGDEADGGVRIHRPMRDEQCARAGIEECASEPR